MNLVLLGAPGSGKGTQSALLDKRLHAKPVSTGQIFREVAKGGTPLGRKVRSYMSEGRLVPDELVIEVVRDRISAVDCAGGFILDGFPRTRKQALALDDLLKVMNKVLVGVINLDVGDEELIHRLSGRRICRKCGAAFHLVFAPPAQENRCGQCGGELYQRPDDKRETIEKRLGIYKAQTAPLIDYYRQGGLLRNIVGIGTPEEVFGRIMAALDL